MPRTKKRHTGIISLRPNINLEDAVVGSTSNMRFLGGQTSKRYTIDCSDGSKVLVTFEKVEKAILSGEQCQADGNTKVIESDNLTIFQKEGLPTVEVPFSRIRKKKYIFLYQSDKTNEAKCAVRHNEKFISRTNEAKTVTSKEENIEEPSCAFIQPTYYSSDHQDRVIEIFTKILADHHSYSYETGKKNRVFVSLMTKAMALADASVLLSAAPVEPKIEKSICDKTIDSIREYIVDFASKSENMDLVSKMLDAIVGIASTEHCALKATDLESASPETVSPDSTDDSEITPITSGSESTDKKHTSKQKQENNYSLNCFCSKGPTMTSEYKHNREDSSSSFCEAIRAIKKLLCCCAASRTGVPGL